MVEALKTIKVSEGFAKPDSRVGRGMLWVAQALTRMGGSGYGNLAIDGNPISIADKRILLKKLDKADEIHGIGERLREQTIKDVNDRCNPPN